MINSTFDPNTILETYRNAFAPVVKAKQDSANLLDRVGRYQYAVAGDYLDWFLNLTNDAVHAASPTQFFAKQTELGSALGEKLRGRGQELAAITSEAQSVLTQLVNDAVAQTSATLKKAA